MLNTNKSISQEAISNKSSYQAGRDVNAIEINIAPIDISNFSFYEEDIKETILFFHRNINSFKDTPFPDNKAIIIEKKNRLNNLSLEYFNDIKRDYLPYFGKIRDFLQNPKNYQYVDMYNSTVLELKSIVTAIRPHCIKFDTIFPLLYGRLINTYNNDKDFMRIRSKIYLFLHFMYYNCDIGIKEEGEL